jgi:hypothetical protein
LGPDITVETDRNHYIWIIAKKIDMVGMVFLNQTLPGYVGEECGMVCIFSCCSIAIASIPA